MGNSELLLTVLVTGFALAISFVVNRFWKRRKIEVDYDEVTRHQAELDHYLRLPFDEQQIGLFYERQIGYLLECAGYTVEFHGAIQGFEDLGRDIIAIKKDEILVIQAKCWSRTKKIREKYIFQLFGSTTHYKLVTKSRKSVRPVFFSTTEFTKNAGCAAQLLEVELRMIPLNKSYPLIKCNVNDQGERIFHLPTDEFYDRVKIDKQRGEFYAKTVLEAAEKGFRRARTYGRHNSA